MLNIFQKELPNSKLFPGFRACFFNDQNSMKHESQQKKSLNSNPTNHQSQNVSIFWSVEVSVEVSVAVRPFKK